MNSTGLNLQLLNKFLQKLGHLKKVIVKERLTYRFFGSSLLLIYDGDESTTDNKEMELKMIDFAHACNITKLNIPKEQENDLEDGYLKGLDNLILILEDFLVLKQES